MAAVAHDGRDAIEEVGCTWIIDDVVLLGTDERCDLVRGRRREAHGATTRRRQRLEPVKDTVRAEEVDLEYTPRIGHGR